MKAFRLILFIIFVFRIDVHAYNIRQISSRDGLSNSAVICLFQDKERFLWAGTYDGLNKYNGVEIETYKPNIKNSNSLSGNVIRKIVESKNDYLWIMTKGGLNKFSRRHNQVEAHFAEFQEDCSIACDEKGNFFILKRTGSLYFYDFEKLIFKEINVPGFLPQRDWVSLLIDANNQVWITNEGVSRLYTIDYSDPLNPIMIPAGTLRQKVRYIYSDKGKIIIIDEKYNLLEFKEKHSVFIKNIEPAIQTYGNDISDILYDGQDIIIGFQTHGVVRLNYKENYAMERLPINCGVFSLLKDDGQDILWIGTDGQGIYACVHDGYIFNGINLEELPIRSKMPVRAIYKDQLNNLWLGTKGNGIIRIKDYESATGYDLQNVTHLSTENGLCNNAVFSFEKSSHHNILWIGSSGPDLNYYDYSDKRIHTLINNSDIPLNDVHCISETSDTTLWISSLYSLFKIDLKRKGHAFIAKKIHRYEFDIKNKEAFNKIYSICHENDSIMWLAVRGNGAIRFNSRNGDYRLISFDDHGIVPMNDILSMHIGASGKIWLGSSYGITCIDSLTEKGFKYHNYNENDGLHNNTIHGILEDNQGELWLSSNNGMILFDSKKKAFRHFNQKSGLKVNEFSDNAYYKDSTSSRYFFGGIDGVIWIEREKDEKSDFTSPIYFAKLRILNEEVDKNRFTVTKDGEDFLQLSHNQNFFTVSFSTNDFINGANLQFSYKLENFNQIWINTNTREAQFTNIPPGDYLLKVKYINEFDKKSQQASFPIRILPPWYFSMYAKIFYLLVCIYLLYLLYIYIRKKYEAKKQKLTLQLSQKYKEEMYENKLRFFTNITHEFCTPLTLIYTPCERILHYKESDTQIKKYAQIILSNAERLNSLVQEIIDFRRIETGNKKCHIVPCNINRICEDVEKSFTYLIEENHINFSMNITQNIMWNTDSSQINTLLNNLISNAFKYTPKYGQIKISVDIENNELVLKVYNSGKGIRNEDIPYIFNRYSVLDNVEQNSIKGLSSRNGLGLAICKSIVETLHGTIDIESQPGTYATFIVRLPEAELSQTATEHSEPAKNVINIEDIDNTSTKTKNSVPEQQESPKIITDNTTTNKSATIVIIDDNEEILWILENILSEDYRILTAKNGHEGFTLITNGLPDLIITDIMMPEQDGISLTKQIKLNPYTMHIPIVIISAKSSMDNKIEGIESGADAYITKPFEAQYVKAIVRQLIDKQQKLHMYYNSPAHSFDYMNGELLSKEDRDFIQEVTSIINQNIGNTEFTPENMADSLCISRRSLYRRFKELELPSPKDFIKKQRIEYAAKLLSSTSLSIQEIMDHSGFTTRSHFHKEFIGIYNISPKEYRNQQNKTLQSEEIQDQ